jgi:small redox-active disulfide protein 2
MNIKILGTGCPKCKQTELIVRKAIAQSDVAATIEKVEDIQEIIRYNVLTTPVVLIDEKVVIKGRVPTVEEVSVFLSQKN